MALRSRTFFTGVHQVQSNLNGEVQRIKARTRKGVQRAGLIIKAESMRMTPVDTGNLINSAYYHTFMGPSGWAVEIGYTAEYAPLVHEIERGYRKPGSQWKFLEQALKDTEHDVLEAIRDETKIPEGVAV